MDTQIDSVIEKILTPILELLKLIINYIFATQTSTLIFGFIFMNAIGYVLMYVDKKIAKQNEAITDEKKKARRIPERTLFLIAILYGSLGIYAGMYKFRHKTLHKSFTIGIPLIIILQVIFTIYALVKNHAS